MSRPSFSIAALRRRISRRGVARLNWRLLLAILVNLLIWYGLIMFLTGR